MFEQFNYLYLFLFSIGIISTIPFSYFLTFIFFKLSQHTYKNNNFLNDNKVLYSCWAGIPKGNVIYIFFSFFIIFLGILYYIHKDVFFIFGSFVAFLLFMVSCLNSLTRLELTSETLSIFQIKYGTETEVYKIEVSTIKSINSQITATNFLVSGFHSLLIITLKDNNQIIIAAPEKEEMEILLSFLQEQEYSKINIS